jgi:hypothetical protein
MSKRKITVVLFFIFSFALGFIVHAIFFPSLLTNNLATLAKQVIENKQAPVSDSVNKALTIVFYDRGEFDPQVVVIGKSYYLGIINNSDSELMTLTSENPLLTTPRGYGKSEQLTAQLYETGTYTVSSSLHPDKVLKVIVK